jgi:hypothetical protein
MPLFPPGQASTIPVTVRADLNALLGQISGSLPQEVDRDGAWDTGGSGSTGIEYRVWRDNPVIGISGNTVSVDMNIFYHFAVAERIRNGGFFGGYSWHQFASCGIGEPARQAHVHMTFALNWLTNYHLQATYSWKDTYGPCNLTFLNISAVSRVQSLVDPKVNDATTQLANAIAAVDFRPQVANLWHALHQPITTPGVAGPMFVNPTGIGASPINGSGTTFTDTFVIYAIALVPDIALAPPGPVGDPFPLSDPPPTMSVLPSPGSGVFQATTQGRLPFSEATTAAKQRLDGTTVNVMGVSSTITVDEVGGNGRLAWVKLDLAGGLQGSVYLTGDMVFDPATEVFSIQHLGLTPAETNAFTALMITSMQDPGFLGSIQSKLRWDLTPKLAAFRGSLNSRLANVPLGSGFTLHGNVATFTSNWIGAFPTTCDPVFPPELCQVGLTQAVFVVALQATGTLNVVGP